MAEVIYYVACSLDGFIATADGGIDWLTEFGDVEAYGYTEFYAAVDAIVMGRTTYEQVLTFGEWPHADRPVWVLARNTVSAVADGVTVSAAAPGDVVAELESLGHRTIWLVGGGELAGSFARDGLITRYILSVMPVLLGSGIGLLGREGSQARLTLESSLRIGDVVQNVYVTGDGK